MSMENSTANLHSGNITKAILDDTTETATFFDPAWQLALTIEYYFRYAVIATGVFGMIANGLVLYALISYNAREAKKRATNLLIIHQNVLDLFSCILLVITYSVGNKENLNGTLGYFICTIIITESAMYCTMCASVINLMTITMERYLKVVHPFWSKKHLKRWMIYVSMVFAWITGILLQMPVAFISTLIKDGNCLPFHVWESYIVKMIYGAVSNIIAFFLPLVLFVYCYGHIVVVMRKQMRVMAGHNVEGNSQIMSASQIQSKRIKWNITKTMIIVSVAFIICWFPINIYFMIVDDSDFTGNIIVGYFATVFLAYVNICMNPFIYAAKHEGVKQKLAQMIVCYRCKVQTVVTDNPGYSNTTHLGTKQTHARVTHV